MKKILYFLSAALLALTSCTNDEPGINGDNELIEAKYLAVNLAANSTGSRAPGDQATGDPNNALYEAGQAVENEVKTIRFFFFDEKGDAMEVKSGSNKNWTDVLPGDANIENLPNIEKTLEAMIILEKGDKEPSSIAAVVNGTFSADLAMVNKSDLVNIIANHTIDAGFPMSSPVYQTADHKVAMEVPVAGHLYSTPTAAKASPVTMYMERVHAKVRMNFATALTGGEKIADGIFKPTIADGHDGTFNGQELCVKILGWNVTNTTKKSYLIKNISTAWPDNLFGANEPWNYAPFFRSFWAQNPTLSAIDDYTYGNFGTGATGAQAKKLGEYTYLQENAADAGSWNGRSTKRPSQVIIAAQLGTYDGTFKPVEFAEWAFHRYTVTDLKKAMLAVTQKFYKKTVNGDGSVVFTQINSDDITFKTATALDGITWNGDGRYFVYAQLSETASTATWHKSNAKDNTDVATAAEINKALKDIGRAKIWTSGYTYYYFDIRHLANALNADGNDEGGYYGVVRNHLYDASIKSIQGLGTPVYDPEEVIYPEKPVEDDSYIAADIKILSWRLVKQDVELDW